MNWWNNLLNTLNRGWNAVLNFGSGGPAGPIRGALQGLQQTANGLLYVITHPVSDLTNSVAAFAAVVTGNQTALLNALRRYFGFTQQHQINPLISWLQKQLNRLWAAIQQTRTWTWKLIWLGVATARVYTDSQISAERAARIQGDATVKAYALAQVKALHTTIEREAASGYSTGYDARVAIITRLLDDAAIRQPVIRDLTSRIITITLDLVAADNPVARLLAGFLVSHVIARLGIDQAIGSLTADLLAPLLGNPKPRDLNSVMRDISARLGAGEQQWATFMADGGPQILQAGEVWRGLTSLTFDAALFAFAAAAVTDPETTARDVSALIRPVGTTLISDAARLLGR